MTEPSQQSRALVIGYGSIGQRHARLLTEMGVSTAVVSRQTVTDPTRFESIAEGLEKFHPRYVVVASPTGRHHADVSQLAVGGYRGTVLVEKPLFDTDRMVAPNHFRAVYVGFNLRFHPALQKLKTLLVSERLVSADIYVGQYLPAWRPGRDYRTSSSARREQGGGVLRDLSHELDLVTWLMGPWRRVVACAGHFSSLEINTEDVAALVAVTERCPAVTIQMNYVDRDFKRIVRILSDAHAYEADLVRHTLKVDGLETPFAFDRDESFRQEHQDAMSGSEATLCSLQEGLENVRMIDACEASMTGGSWIFRGAS